MPVTEHPPAGPSAVSPAGAGRRPLPPRLGSQQLTGRPLSCAQGSPGRLRRKPRSCSCHRLLRDLGPCKGGLGGREPRAAMGRGAGLGLEAADSAALVDAGARPGPGQAAQHAPPGQAGCPEPDLPVPFQRDINRDQEEEPCLKALSRHGHRFRQRRASSPAAGATAGPRWGWAGETAFDPSAS